MLRAMQGVTRRNNIIVTAAEKSKLNLRRNLNGDG